MTTPEPQSAEDRDTAARRRGELLSRFALAGTLAFLCLLFAITTRDHVFIKSANLINVASQSAINTMIAVGMTLVIVTAGIDLSVGSIVGLVAVFSAGVMVQGLDFTVGAYRVQLLPELPGLGGVAIGLAAGLLVGALAGLVNALAIVRFKVTPFIATLAMMLIARGAAHLYSVSPVRNVPDAFVWLGQGRLAQVPIPVYVAIGVVIVGWLILAKTPFGRHVYAVGGNEEAARLSGIPVGRTKLWVYVASGLCSGIAGMVLAAQLEAGDPKLGQTYELDAIAAAVLGGTSLMGGRGTILGTVLGALIIGVLDNGLTMLHVSSFAQMVIKGLVILGAVILDQKRQNA
ncbi:MAG: ribose ABC transporter permease [Armatimonadia bacterium]|nr:ribose ABC transporter permease [Armatimonadia bacterium]